MLDFKGFSNIPGCRILESLGKKHCVASALHFSYRMKAQNGTANGEGTGIGLSNWCNLLGVVVSVAQLRTVSYGMKAAVTTWRKLVGVVVCVA